jgi:hypothetical protein
VNRRRRALALAGQVTMLASAPLPWIRGEFGLHETLPLLRLNELSTYGAHISLPPAAIEVAPPVLGAAMLSAALVRPLGALLRLPASQVTRVEVVLASTVIGLGIVALAALLWASRYALVDGPGPGAPVALGGAALLLASRSSRRPAKEAATTPSVAGEA